MVCSGGEGLDLCSYNECLCFSLEIGGFEPFVCFFRINIREGYLPCKTCNAFSSHLVCICCRSRCFAAVLIFFAHNATVSSPSIGSSLRSNSFLSFVASFWIEQSFLLFSCCWTRWRSGSLVDVRYATRSTLLNYYYYYYYYYYYTG